MIFEPVWTALGSAGSCAFALIASRGEIASDCRYSALLVLVSEQFVLLTVVVARSANPTPEHFRLGSILEMQ